jgi:hypothetical protein
MISSSRATCGSRSASLEADGRELAVLPTDVVNAADRRLASERAVRSARVVVVEPVWQRLVSLSM